ncbi:MAG: hypothetical protein II969_15045 [Anaerolineaceae bacterium]|nr:hypothetical protein [Anaerolineaceae bacterium]
MAVINFQNKDRLFRFIFGNPENKAWTLSLYNAINGTSYTNPDDITITTIKNVIYMSMKNDISFLIEATMNFWEQQSSYNPNIPIRFLPYAGMVYSKYIEVNNINIYSSTQKMLPVPKFICFYNGLAEKEDCIELRLSSAFPEGSDPDIEIKVKMLNINYGRNMDLLNACEPLRDYSWLVDRIRYYKELTGDIETAVDMALREMSEESVIKSFLMSHKAEVKNMCITEYDEAKTMNMFKQEGRDEGREEEKFFSIQKLMKNLKITAEQAMDVLEISAEDRKRYLALL